MNDKEKISVAWLAGVAIVLCAILLLLYADKTPSLRLAKYHIPSLPVDERVQDLLSHMTLEEKVGQMALIEKDSISPTDAAFRGIGAILSGGGAKPDDNTLNGWRDMVNSYVEASRRTRTGIPILYGVDANHGQGNVPGATIFPHQIGLGAAADPSLVEAVARATGKESLAIGSYWNFSPSLDLPTDIRWGRVYETYSDDAMLAGDLGEAYVRGLQAEGVAASPKHYLGVGSMRWGTAEGNDYEIDKGVTPASEALLRSSYLPPFLKAVNAGAMSVMVGLNTWGDTKIAASEYLITDVLKGELGFQGFVVSDWYGVYEISDDKYLSAVTAINAGVDMVMLPYEYDVFIRDVLRAVRAGDITIARIDDAVGRILRAKFALGLFDEPASASIVQIGNSEHRALAREAVAKSLVVLKNDGSLPLSGNLRKIRIAGSAADNIGMQAGGWTVEWQGIDGNNLPGATSILTGILDASGNAQVQYDKDGHFDEKDIADVGIAIVGEKPYAEGWGDNALPSLSDEDMEAIARLDAASERVVVIIISGRPLIITDALADWDALIAAWLPGSEGAGVADVLFGHVRSTGKLPLPWPMNIEQLPFESGTSRDGTPPLFPRGFGLTL